MMRVAAFHHPRDATYPVATVLDRVAGPPMARAVRGMGTGTFGSGTVGCRFAVGERVEANQPGAEIEPAQRPRAGRSWMTGTASLAAPEMQDTLDPFVAGAGLADDRHDRRAMLLPALEHRRVLDSLAQHHEGRCLAEDRGQTDPARIRAGTTLRGQGAAHGLDRPAPLTAHPSPMGWVRREDRHAPWCRSPVG